MKFPTTRWDDGTAAVEFALLLPVVFVLACAVIDYGQASNLITQLNSAARAGAQYALAHPNDADGIAWAAQHSIRTPTADVTVTVPGDSPLSGSNPFYCTCSDSDPVATNQVSCDTAETGVGTCTGTKKFFVLVTATQTFSSLLPYPGIPSSSLTVTGTATVQVR